MRRSGAAGGGDAAPTAYVGQRNQLRVALARLRLAHDGGDTSAAEALQDVLLEDPGQSEALLLLAGYYERTGSESDLADMLAQAFDGGDRDEQRGGGRGGRPRLGSTLEPQTMERAAAIYERALVAVPRRVELLRRLLALQAAGDVTAEQAARMEALLDVETGAEAGKLAHELVAAWTALGDADAVRRVLEKGHAQAAGDATFFSELEKLYRGKQDWSALADLYAAEAARREDGGEAAALLVEAASLRRGRLADVSGGLQLLRRARARAPGDIQILEQLSRALVAHGELGAAAAEVRVALEDKSLAPEQRVRLYLLRAKLEASRGDHRAAVTVLEQAYALSPDVAGVALTAELEAWRHEAAAANALTDLKEATLRLADIARAAGDAGAARQLLLELVERGAADADTLQMAQQLAEAEGDLEGAFLTARHLVQRTSGEAQLSAAQHLVALAEQVGQAAVATEAIEAAFAANPEQLGLADVLAPLYAQTGELAKLAGLLLD